MRSERLLRLLIFIISQTGALGSLPVLAVQAKREGDARWLRW